MPSAPIENSAGVPTKEQIMQRALEQVRAIEAAEPKTEIPPPVEPSAIRRIEHKAREIAANTGWPLPEGVHKSER